MITTTMAVAVTRATLSFSANAECSQFASGCENAASPTMPFSTPIEVMPICTVDSHRVGCSCSSMAASAPLSPASTITARRAFREAVNAISDMANKALSRIRNSSKATSMGRRGDSARVRKTSRRA